MSLAIEIGLKKGGDINSLPVQPSAISLSGNRVLYLNPKSDTFLKLIDLEETTHFSRLCETEIGKDDLRILIKKQYPGFKPTGQKLASA